MTLRLSRTFFGTASLERRSEGFEVALRRATVPPEQVPEHAHDTAHLILAIDDDYLSGAVGAAAWRGPSMLVYNPPGTLHRDRFRTTGGRFLAIDIPRGFEPHGIIDALAIGAGPVRAQAARVMAALMGDVSGLELEDQLLALSAALTLIAAKASAPPPWLQVAAEAITDLAANPELRVQDIARLAGVHPVHLAREFARHLRCSPGEAIRRLRVEGVAASLAKRRSLGNIAYDHGFADHAHMTRCFRAFYGVTPSAFRAAFD